MNIYQSRVDLNDESAKTAFMSVIPSDSHLHTMVAALGIGWGGTYDLKSHVAHYINSDGKVATRFTVTEMTDAEAKSIHDACESLSEWSSQGFHNLVNRVLGTNFSRVQ